MSWNSLAIFSDPWFAGGTVAVVLLLLYAARTPVHQLLNHTGNAWYAVCRIASSALRDARMRLRDRNREVILSAGSHVKEARIERELQRISNGVGRDIHSFPMFTQHLTEQLIQLEKDCQATAQPSPEPPSSIAVLENLAKLPGADNAAVLEVVQAMQGAVERNQKLALAAYRDSVRARQKLATTLLPRLRKLTNDTHNVERKLGELEQRLPNVDALVADFRAIQANSDAAVNALSVSFSSKFVAATSVLLVIVLAGFVNFHLLAIPMADAVGSDSFVGPLRTADVAAFVMILLNVTTGIIVLEALGITRMFTALRGLDDNLRKRLAWGGAGVLLTLATGAAALAYIHDPLAATSGVAAADDSAAASGAAISSGVPWLASAGQMILAFVLALALAASGMVLETFVRSGRVIAGSVLGLLLGTLAVITRLAGYVGRGAMRLLMDLYDVMIFLPLGLQRALQRLGGGGRRRAEPDSNPFSAPPSTSPLDEPPVLRDRVAPPSRTSVPRESPGAAASPFAAREAVGEVDFSRFPGPEDSPSRESAAEPDTKRRGATAPPLPPPLFQ
jgi:hypothetical protein